MRLWPPRRKEQKWPARSEGHFNSALYWKKRYGCGGTSGAGSYGRLADYKAKFINNLVDELSIQSVVEFGSGDGNQASLFEFDNYLGVDAVPQVVEKCSKRFFDRETWAFKTIDHYEQSYEISDLGMSLDVIYHLVEDEVFEEYMSRLFGSARRFVLIYSSDHDELVQAAHVRHRKYSDWIFQNEPGWNLKWSYENPFKLDVDGDPQNCSFASFALFERCE